MKSTYIIKKVLSSNDVGLTGGHQGGMLIPKKGELLSFFPYLNPKDLNPRSQMTFYDCNGEKWHFTFIYYNNKLHGGTRNEFRLTGMTRYFRKFGLQAGDKVILEKSSAGYNVNCEKALDEVLNNESSEIIELTLGDVWKIVKI